MDKESHSIWESFVSQPEQELLENVQGVEAIAKSLNSVLLTLAQGAKDAYKTGKSDPLNAARIEIEIWQRQVDGYLEGGQQQFNLTESLEAVLRVIYVLVQYAHRYKISEGSGKDQDHEIAVEVPRRGQ